jgi:hypothetical protein|uniref:Uncharacterized protein n=1 Tax=Myoviridae sp. ctNQV2 TaxID=2827683 RepID=A0A8S5RZN5_9CAUD|nr:MAG: hypothetical protein [Bacteriophage sp.]DAF44136.1 MAG TPA: hypothetical protein [Myoviridae sp. ctNQV2]
MRKIKITKEQHELAIKEAVSLTVNTGSTNGNINQAIQNTKRDAQRDGINPNKVGYNIPAQENVVVSKKAIKEMRIKNLLKNATVLTKKEISEKINGKLNESSDSIMYSDLINSEVMSLSDEIKQAKENYTNAISMFFDTLFKQGRDMKTINKIINMADLTKYIPKAEINRKESEFKNAQNMAKQNIKDQQKEVKQGV